MLKTFRILFWFELQESIPVGWIPSAAMAVGGEGCVCLPGGVSAPVHAGIPAWGICPSACWEYLPRGVCVCPSACWDTPPVDSILDTRLWKHYLSSTTVADGNKPINFLLCFTSGLYSRNKSGRPSLIEPPTVGAQLHSGAITLAVTLHTLSIDFIQWDNLS